MKEKDYQKYFTWLMVVLFIICWFIWFEFKHTFKKINDVYVRVDWLSYDIEQLEYESYNRDQEALRILDKLEWPLQPGDEWYDPDWLDNYDTEMCDGLLKEKIDERYTWYEWYYCTRRNMKLDDFRWWCNWPIFIKCENLLIYEDEYKYTYSDSCDSTYFPYSVVASKVSDRLPGWEGYLTKEYMLNNCKAFNYIKEW